MAFLLSAQRFPRTPLDCIRTLQKWRQRFCTRQALKGLTEDQLRDIGLTYGEAYTEARRPFWQG